MVSAIGNKNCHNRMSELLNEWRKQIQAKGVWVDSYAGSNVDEFFAELTMWYFGTHADTRMTGPKPENGPEGLKKYNPEAHALTDDFYSGRIVIGIAEPRRRPPDAATNSATSPRTNPPFQP
jgi:hypothetical protein